MIPSHEDTPGAYPFWTYLDLAVFAALALPSLVAGALLAKVFALVWPVRLPEQQLLLPGQFLGYGFWFLCLYLLLKTRYDRAFWPSLRFTFPAPRFWLSFAEGPLLALAVVGLGDALHTPVIDLPFGGMLSSRFSIVLLGVFITTLGPVCEELAFRGFLLPLLSRSCGAALGIFLTAVPFALLHGPQYRWSWQHLLLVLLAGCVFGWVRYRSGSTASAAAIHSTYNLTFFAVFLLQKLIFAERF